MKTHTNKEAASHFKVNVRTIVRWLKSINYSYYDKIGQSFLSKEQLEIVTGSMLGDGCVNNNRFAIKQKESRREYIEFIHAMLQPYSRPIYDGCSKLKDQYFPYSQFYTSTHPEFIKLRKKWYANKQKIVPRDLKLTQRILAHWFVQDGCHRYTHRQFILSTQSFLLHDVDHLVGLLKKDLGLEFHRTRKGEQWEITSNICDYKQIFDILYQHIHWNCFEYKVDAKLIKKINPKMGANKLSPTLAAQIRNLHTDGWSSKDLAIKFNVSFSSIRNVLNNVTYKVKKTDVYLGGTSVVEMVYNPKTNTSIADSVLQL